MGYSNQAGSFIKISFEKEKMIRGSDSPGHNQKFQRAEPLNLAFAR
jgi:hypothetical protein